MSWTEILGFVTGAASVWLYVRQRVSAWPLGIANSAFWLVLFCDSKLYLDSALQIVYILLGLGGWYWWINGGERRKDLPVVHTRRAETAVLVGFAIASTRCTSSPAMTSPGSRTELATASMSALGWPSASVLRCRSGRSRWLEVTGTPAQRLAAATAQIDDLLLAP
jgi:nicotinamide mononucleotide transporter